MIHPPKLSPLDDFDKRLVENVCPANWINPVAFKRYDLVVIGAGTAGLVTAAGAAGLGARVALVERSLMGGDCLNHGCVPSKALISAARQIAAIRRSSDFGIHVESMRFEFSTAMERMRRLRSVVSSNDSAQRFRSLGVDVFFGQGCFTGRKVVSVDGQRLHFRKAVIATGARPKELPIPGLQDVDHLTNETLFQLTSLPPRLLIVGAGPIGCEMAQTFARFGSQVILFEEASQILSREDEEAARIVQDALVHDGVQLVLGANIVRIEEDQTGKVVVAEKNGVESRYSGDRLLSCSGRSPNVDGLALEVAGVVADPQTGIHVDDMLRTTNRRIYAAGDVCAKAGFTHLADFHARIAIQNTLFMGRARQSRLIVPRATYTSPELAHVGIDPQKVRTNEKDLDVYTQLFSDVDRSILEGEEQGFLRVYCAKGSDRILGATIVGAHAGEMIGAIVTAMKFKVGLGKLATVIHPYPTQAETLRKIGDQFNRSRLTPAAKLFLNTWLKLSRLF